MPVRRTYDVETSNLEQMQPLLTKNQEYFKSYICMVLVTLIICLIFFLIALFIANNKNQNVNHGDIESESGFNALEFNRENSSILKTTLEHTSTTRKHYTTPISIIFINRTTSSLPISSSNDELSSSITASFATNGSSTDQLHLSEKLHQHGSTITPTNIISTTPSDVITTDGIIDLGLREIHSTTPSDVITTGVVSDLSVKESHSTVTSDITTTDEVTDLRVREIHSTTLKDVIPTDGVTDLSVREILSTTPSDVTTTDVVTDLEVKTIHSTTSSDVITTDGVTDLGVLEIHSTTPSGATTTDVLKDLSIREILSTTQSDVITTDVVTDLEVKKIHSTTLSDITTDGVTDLGVIIHSTTPSGETTDKVSLATTESTPKASSTTNSPIRRIESYLVSSDDSNSTALNTCTSKSCHSTASRLLNLIDKDVDKCYNFYDFACGQRHTVRSNEEMLQKFNYDVFKKSLDKINNSSDEGQKGFLQFYKSCIEHDPLMVASNLSQIYEIVKRNVNGFILNENDTILVDGMHISELISKMILLNHAPLFDVDFVLDESKTYIFKVMPPKFKILSTIMAKCKFEYESELRYSETLSDFYSQCVRSDVYKNIYIQHMDTILNVVKAFDDIQNATKKDELLKELKVSFEDYYEFYQKLPNILDLEYSERAQGISDCSENEKLYEATIEEWNTVFNERYDSVKIDWIYLFKNLVGKNITPDAKVQIYFKPFFNDLFEKKLTVKKMHNLLVATFIRDYYIELMLPDQQCLEKTIQLHPEVASNLYHDYLKRNISKLQDTVTNIFDNIKNTFNNTVFNNSIAFDLNMKQDMSTILNDIQLDFYKPFPKNAIVSEACDKYLDCFLRASKELRQRKYLAWNQNIAESNYMWFHTARVYDMNPVTVYQAYKIAIPYGMFYGYNSNLEELPSYLLMSTIGRKLAYHLANYFSIIGLALLRQKFNKTISYLHDVDVSCATKESYKEYDNDILSCIINQYNEPQNLEIKSKPAFFDVTVDYVLNQIISDGSAIRLAYDTAFSKRSDQKLPWITTEYTDEQLFYISAVQEFCDSNEDDLFTFSNKLYQDGMLPKQVRVFDFLKSDTNFASIFKCPNGTKYNPDGKCITFPYLVKPTPDPEDNEFVS